jgi:hypothetical protein
MKKPISNDMKRARRQEAYIGFLKRKKAVQERLMLETTSVKDMKKT